MAWTGALKTTDLWGVPELSPEETRAAFLKLIDRPRVALDPKTETMPAPRGYIQVAFSYATQAGERVPGILVRGHGAKGRQPVVIAMHGTGGNKESQMDYLQQLAQKGFVGVAIDGRFHGARAQSKHGSDYTDAILRAYRGNGEHPFFYDTVWDIMRLIDYLAGRDDVDAGRIGLFGISKGGIEAYLAAAVDPRISVVVPCISVESFRWALEHDSWHSRIGTVQKAFDAAASDAGVAGPGPEFVRQFYDRIAPGIYSDFDGPAMMPLIAPRPLLAINGEIDPRTPLPGVELAAAAARKAYQAKEATNAFVLLVQPNTGHKVLPTSLDTAKQWFIRWLRP